MARIKIYPEVLRTVPKRVLSTCLLLAPFKDCWGGVILVRTERANSALRRVVGKKAGTAEQLLSGFWSKGMAGGCLRGNKAVSEIQPVKSS